MFWVISVYFNIRNTLPKFCPFLLGYPVYMEHLFLMFLDHTHNAPQLVGFLWTSDQLVAETSTLKHSQQTNIHAVGGIRTHDLSRRAAVDLRLRPRGHWDRHKLHNTSSSSSSIGATTLGGFWPALRFRSTIFYLYTSLSSFSLSSSLDPLLLGQAISVLVFLLVLMSMAPIQLLF